MTQTGRNQRGMASILITMITMMVISLIVLGFANVARRERGQSLDRQLSTQAFYAAETGIEDARKVIDSAVRNGAAVPGRANCDGAGSLTPPAGVLSYPSGDRMKLNGQNVTYSCLLVNPSPTSLQYKGVDNVDSTVIPVKPASGTLASIDITWTPNGDTKCSTTNGSLPAGCNPAVPSGRCLNDTTNTDATGNRFFVKQSDWGCRYGLMRMDIVPTAPPGGLSRNTLLTRSLAAWVVPTQSTTATGDVNYTVRAGQTPYVTKAKCQQGPYGTCTATISNLASGGNEFTLRLTSMYQPSDVTVTAKLDGGAAAGLTGAQAVVDVTGKAQDVLRRIVARIPVSASRGQTPGYAIQSNGSICKRFEVRQDYFRIDGNLPTGPGNSDEADNAMCKDTLDPVAVSTPDMAAPACVARHDIVLTLDTSESMFDRWNTTTRIAKTREVASAFVDNTNINLGTNYLAVTTFNNGDDSEGPKTGPKVIAELQYGKPALRSLVGKVDAIRETGTYYTYGLNLATQALNRSPLARADAPNVLVFVSDGAPLEDSTDVTRVTDAMKRAGYIIYTIAIGDTGSGGKNTIDKRLLQSMAGNGGYYTDAQNEQQLTKALADIGGKLRCAN